MSTDKPQDTYVVVSPQGVVWIGLADDEQHAWTIALGWPSQDEIDYNKRAGWYVTRCNVTWTKP